MGCGAAICPDTFSTEGTRVVLSAAAKKARRYDIIAPLDESFLCLIHRVSGVEIRMLDCAGLLPIYEMPISA